MHSRLLLLGALAALGASVAMVDGLAQGKAKQKGQPPQTIDRVKPDLYVVSGFGGNVTVRVTPDGLIVVDTKNRGDDIYAALMDQIRTVSSAPVRFVIVTHHHQDHSGNTQNFLQAGARVIAHEREKANLATYNPQGGRPAAPTITFESQYTVKLGGVEARVYHFGSAHTDGDSLVYFPDLKTIAAGDAVAGTAPAPDYAGGHASLVSWRNVLAGTAKLDFDTVIPGHSDAFSTTMTRVEFDLFQRRLDLLVSRGAAAVKQGVSKEELYSHINTADLGEAWSLKSPAWAARLDGFYADLSSAAR